MRETVVQEGSEGERAGLGSARHERETERPRWVEVGEKCGDCQTVRSRGTGVGKGRVNSLNEMRGLGAALGTGRVTLKGATPAGAGGGSEGSDIGRARRSSSSWSRERRPELAADVGAALCRPLRRHFHP